MPAPLVALLLSGLPLLTCGACSSGPSGAPTPAEVRAVLSRHAQALLDRAPRAFLADVDTAAAARGFRGRQAAEIDNISDVPLQSWTYTLGGAVRDTQAQQAAARRYGAPALIVHLTLRYQLRDVDPSPDRHDLWWTFVRRDGHVRLAGDDDLADAGGTSWKGIWDYGPVVVARGASGLVLGHIGNATALAGIADAVDAAVPAVDAVWGTQWARRVAVLVPAQQSEFAALTGVQGAVSDLSAVAVTAGMDPAPARPYGQRLVVDPAAVGTLSRLGLQIVVRHELTHLATAAVTPPGMPRWVMEGFADFVAERGSGQTVPATAAELRADVRRGRVPSVLPPDSAFAPGAPDRPQAYEQAWLACRLIAERAGTDGLVRFYRAVAGATTAPGQAVAAALAQVLHTSVSGFTTRWRAYLVEQLR